MEPDNILQKIKTVHVPGENRKARRAKLKIAKQAVKTILKERRNDI